MAFFFFLTVTSLMCYNNKILVNVIINKYYVDTYNVKY